MEKNKKELIGGHYSTDIINLMNKKGTCSVRFVFKYYEMFNVHTKDYVFMPYYQLGIKYIEFENYEDKETLDSINEQLLAELITSLS